MTRLLGAAGARLKVKLSFDEQLFWQRIDPEFAGQFDREDIPLDLHAHLEGPATDPRFEYDESVKQLFLDLFDVRREAPVDLANSEVNDGAESLFIVSK